MKPSVLARIASQLSKTSAIVDAVESKQTRRTGEQAEYVTPDDELEISVAEIWMRLLRVERVGRNDDFFLLGGHSLLATQMISRVFDRFSVELPLVSVFANPTLATFASVVRKSREDGRRSAIASMMTVDRPAHLPLSFGQRRLWFLDQLEPGSSFYNVALKWRLRGELDVEALEAALREISARHEVLRTVYGVTDGEPVQLILPAGSVPVAVTDLSGEPEARVKSWVAEESNRSFDLARGPVFRASLATLSEQEHVLVLNTHHIATDGWSFGVLRGELSALYEAFSAGEPNPLPALPLQYADYAVWQRRTLAGESLERQLSYWREQLKGAPASIELPTDKARPAVQTYRGSSRTRLIPVELVERLKTLSREQSATLYMTLLAGFNVLLSRYSGQTDIVVGSAIAGRTHRDTERLVGLFVNSLALRTDLSGDPGFVELLKRVRAVTVGAYSHQDVPFERLVEELNPVRDSSRSPLYQVMLVLQNLPAQQARMSGIEISGFGSASETSQMDLLLNLVEGERGITATIIYNTDLYEAGTIERMLGHYEHVLASVAQNPSLRVTEVPLLTAAELLELTSGVNRNAAPYPEDKTLHELISAHAVATPGATAVLFADERLTYGELEQRSNRLARHLAGLGIQRGDRVGVYLERSLDLMISLIAVQKTGAAYVPLDPHYPAKRVESILEDAGVKTLLTVSSLQEKLPANAGLPVLLDTEAAKIASHSSDSFASPAEPDDLVYIIFTSGSTGRPKGVEIRHRSVVNLMASMQALLAMTDKDVFPALASVGFDMSVPELYLPLATGGTLALGEAHLAGNGEELARFLRRHSATIVHATPTTWMLLLDAGFTAQGLKRCIGAEPLPQRVFERLMEAAPGTPLSNFYGPTETTVWSTVQRFTSATEPVTVGRALANQQVYVLDPAGNVCPVGVPGEITIAGTGVARGYCDRPDLTAEKFIPNPFGAGLMYRTSDVGRWTKNGTIEHLGRADHQVKLRGFRIELGEIEAVLTTVPGIREAVAVAREDTPGDKRLVAYLVSDQPIDGSVLRARLKESLPDYMVPSAFVELDRMPLTPNGKVDRLHLPAPLGDTQQDHQGHEPRTYMETLLAEIWKDILRVQYVNTRDDFFELGGHSLLAAAMINKLSETLGYRVRLSALFEAPTLGALALAAENQGIDQDQVTAIVPIHRTGWKPALFCVSRPNVNSLGFIFLARSLSGGLPVYGLQSNMVNDGVLAPFTQEEYEEKAAEYVAEMRAIQPEGPYFLTGFCEGAHIAFEMARQLEAMGLEVAKLFILDVWPVENTVDRNRFMLYKYFRVFKRHLQAIRRRRLPAEVRQRQDMLLATRKQFIDSKLLADPEARRLLTKRIESRYWPGKEFAPTIYNGDVVVFRVAKQLFYRVRDESLGWASRVTGKVEIVRVPGTHGLILREPGVSVVARELEARIDEYLAQKVNQMSVETNP